MIAAGDVSGPARAADAQAVDLLEALVRVPSLSGQEAAVAALAVERMAAMGLCAEIDAAGNAVGRLGAGPRRILLLGHIDTVAGEVPVRREGDLLYGRGTVDAKGPFAAFVMAAARIGAVIGWQICVVGAVEEECATSKGARHVAATHARPDCIVIGEPSAWDRITIGYKGRMLIDYALSREMSHTAGQTRRVAEEAVTFWDDILAYAEAHNQDVSKRFETLDPSLRTIQTSGDGLYDRVEMGLGLRLPPDLEPEAIERYARDKAGDARLVFHGVEQAYRAEKRNALTRAFLSAIRAEGSRAAFVSKTGTSDMNVLGPCWGCPIVAYGPGDSSLDHTPDEHVSVKEYLRAIRVLERVLRRLTSEA